MTPEMKVVVLNQSFEESRYYRRFHHTVWTLFVTFYILLLGAEVSSPGNFSRMRPEPRLWIPFSLLLFLLIPGYVSRIVLRYHRTIATLNSLIANLMPDHAEIEALCGNVGRRREFVAAFHEFAFLRYKGIIETGANPYFVGAGHWFFLFSLWGLVLCDLLLFLLR